MTFPNQKKKNNLLHSIYIIFLQLHFGVKEQATNPFPIGKAAADLPLKICLYSPHKCFSIKTKRFRFVNWIKKFLWFIRPLRLLFRIIAKHDLFSSVWNFFQTIFFNYKGWGKILPCDASVYFWRTGGRACGLQGLTLSGLGSEINVRPGGGGQYCPPMICLILTQLGLS